MDFANVTEVIKNINDIDCPSDIIEYPGMTTPDEKKILYLLARDHFIGTGIIIDAGVFLGASTNAFACGLRDSANHLPDHLTHKAIRSYDIAIWVQSMNKYLNNPKVLSVLDGFNPQEGDSFKDILLRLLDKHSALIDLQIGNIVELASTDQQIEIAFFDCLKTFKRDQAAFMAFGPHYIPDHSIVIQQDYFYESAPHLKIRQEFLAPYFIYLGGIQDTAIFGCRQEIPPEYFASDPILELSIEHKVSLLRSAVDRAPNSRKRFYTRLSIVEFLLENKLKDQARKELEDIVEQMDEQPERAYGPRVSGILSNLSHLVGLNMT